MDASCCLCGQALSDAVSKKKWKRLHGLSCTTLKQVLERLVSDRTALSLAWYTETCVENALICGQCDGKLVSVSKLEEQLSLLKTDIDQIKALHEVQEPSASSSTTPLRKRSATASACTVPTKVPRMDSISEQKTV